MEKFKYYGGIFGASFHGDGGGVTRTDNLDGVGGGVNGRGGDNNKMAEENSPL